ncbi:ras-like protein [Antechinus flavipes]|uniref:ras-like protein n=1 Tax=Antechinus flavipes TaxID=38775 RepID=UPI00223591D0|nr:ras-like protein [Antechinus flavipes]
MISFVHTSIGDPDRGRTKMYKLAVMGTFCVGKSALTIQFVKNRFLTEYNPTIQDSYCKQIVVAEELCQLDIMDTTGIEAFCPMRDKSIRWGEGFLLVYAVNDPHSFENVNVIWNRLQIFKGTKPVPVVLVANKVDVTDRLVDPTRGQEVARRFGVPYVETSAKTGQGVEQAFHELIGEIRRMRAEKELKSDLNTEQREVCGCKCCTVQ